MTKSLSAVTNTHFSRLPIEMCYSIKAIVIERK